MRCLVGVRALWVAACGVLFASSCSVLAPGSSTPADVPAAADPRVSLSIKVGSILDHTGPLAPYGMPMANAERLAISEINASGGVLGRPLELVAFDSRSSDEGAALAAQELLESSEVAVVHGGITSSSREVIRPLLGADETLYFYNVLYEGGVCDRNTFVTGETPSQQLEPMLEWASGRGLKKWYVVAADYGFGHISSLWVKDLAARHGAQLVADPAFFDLSVDNFAAEITEIESSGADLIISFLVGTAHLEFYKQWSSSGLNQSTTIVSTSFGFAEEHVRIGPASEGVIAAYPFFSGLGSPAADAFEALWRESGISSSVTPAAVATWNAWHLWAAAANAAGSVDRDVVIGQIESGVSYDGPSGFVSLGGGSHHLTTPMRLWEADGLGQFIELAAVESAARPVFEEASCDLIARPLTNQQYTP